MLNPKLPNNTKLSEKAKLQAAKSHALTLLGNSYALWFIYLAECLKAREETRKVALNYAYQVLIQMKNHNLEKPDEVSLQSLRNKNIFRSQ